LWIKNGKKILRAGSGGVPPGLMNLMMPFSGLFMQAREELT
jgi:hypothetical protein